MFNDYHSNYNEETGNSSDTDHSLVSTPSSKSSIHEGSPKFEPTSEIQSDSSKESESMEFEPVLESQSDTLEEGKFTKLHPVSETQSDISKESGDTEFQPASESQSDISEESMQDVNEIDQLESESQIESSHIGELNWDVVKEETLENSTYLNNDFEYSKLCGSTFVICIVPSSNQIWSPSSETLSTNQSILMFHENEEPWIGSLISFVDHTPDNYFRLTIKIFPWSRRDLPQFGSSSSLKLMVVSKSMSRNLRALNELTKKLASHSKPWLASNIEEEYIQKGFSINSLKASNTRQNSKLKFNSIDSYLKEMSLNLVKEEILAYTKHLNCEFQTMKICGSKYKIGFYKSESRSNVKSSLFTMSSAVLLFRGDEEPWIGRVIEVENMSGDFFETDLIIQIYSWSRKDLPMYANQTKFKIMVPSLPTSRCLQAMNKLSDETFDDLLSGKSNTLSYETEPRAFEKNYCLNDSQNLAVSTALSQKYTVIQGPPGTGKTKTIVEMIKQILQNGLAERVLLVASSNSSVDNVAENFIGTPLERQALRFVSAARSRDYDEKHVLARICLHLNVYKNLPKQYRYCIRGKNIFDLVDENAKGFKKERFELIEDELQKAKIIFCTTVSAGSGYFKDFDIPVVIMDEATQSSEPNALIPLTFSGVKKFVMIGDQKQLDCFCLNGNLSMSLFERVIKNRSISNLVFLDTQYRMHPDISEFPRNRFYDGKLKDGKKFTDKSSGALGALFLWDTKGIFPENKFTSGSREDRGGSFRNPGEAECIVEVVKDLLQVRKFKPEQIGIITPYSAQRDQVTLLLVDDEEINPSSKDFDTEEDLENFNCPKTVHIVNGITVASVDAFQGREKEVMVMSCVRSNKGKQIGFLKDERRLNVAITRARSHLIIIGDAECLRGTSLLWRDFLSFVKEKMSLHNK